MSSMFSRIIHMSSLAKYIFKSFAYLNNYTYITEFWQFFVYCRHKAFLICFFENIVSQSVIYFFLSLNNVYQRTEVLRFDDVQFINFIFLWIMVHFEFILLDSVRLGWSGFCFVLFFYTWIFNCLSIIHLKDYHFHTKLPLHLSRKSVDHIWVYFGLSFTLLIYLSLFISIPYFLECCSFRSLEIW